MQITTIIAAVDFGKFHEIMCATGGRYISNPVHVVDGVKVHYSPGDYAAECKAWEQYNTPIREVRVDQAWRRALRRCGLRF